MTPLVLLHGFAGTPAAWDDVALPGAIALALPGHGRAAAASWDAAIDDVAARVSPDAIAVGYSLGARVALGLLARDRVRAAILISVNPGLPDGDDVARAARRADDARWAALLRARGTAGFAEAWQAQPLFASQAHADPARRAARRAARDLLDAEPLARSLETMGLAEMPDLAPALAARAHRAHLIVGREDAKFVAIAGGLAERAPALVVEVMDQVGHDPTLEAPDALRRVIERALARW